jgi:hypothetical protein
MGFVLITAMLCVSTFAAINIPSDGSDGEFHPTESVEVDLSIAQDGHWTDPGNGNGVYDAEQWAVIFKL